MVYKQKPLSQAQQRAHRAALKGFRGDNASYVTRKVTRGVGSIENFVPMSDGTRRYASLNYVMDKLWNGEVMA